MDQLSNNDASVSYSDGTATFQTLDIISEKCKRDVGYIVDAWINDLSKGGNIETRSMALQVISWCCKCC